MTGRVSFTPEDKEELASYLARLPKSDRAFPSHHKAFALDHPRHTWQAWMDHYKKGQHEDIERRIALIEREMERKKLRKKAKKEARRARANGEREASPVASTSAARIEPSPEEELEEEEEEIDELDESTDPRETSVSQARVAKKIPFDKKDFSALVKTFAKATLKGLPKTSSYNTLANLNHPNLAARHTISSWQTYYATHKIAVDRAVEAKVAKKRRQRLEALDDSDDEALSVASSAAKEKGKGKGKSVDDSPKEAKEEREAVRENESVVRRQQRVDTASSSATAGPSHPESSGGSVPAIPAPQASTTAFPPAKHPTLIPAVAAVVEPARPSVPSAPGPVTSNEHQPTPPPRTSTSQSRLGSESAAPEDRVESPLPTLTRAERAALIYALATAQIKLMSFESVWQFLAKKYPERTAEDFSNYYRDHVAEMWEEVGKQVRQFSEEEKRRSQSVVSTVSSADVVREKAKGKEREIVEEKERVEEMERLQEMKVVQEVDKVEETPSPESVAESGVEDDPASDAHISVETIIPPTQSVTSSSNPAPVPTLQKQSQSQSQPQSQSQSESQTQLPADGSPPTPAPSNSNSHSDNDHEVDVPSPFLKRGAKAVQDLLLPSKDAGGPENIDVEAADDMEVEPTQARSEELDEGDRAVEEMLLRGTSGRSSQLDADEPPPFEDLSVSDPSQEDVNADVSRMETVLWAKFAPYANNDRMSFHRLVRQHKEEQEEEARQKARADEMRLRLHSEKAAADELARRQSEELARKQAEELAKKQAEEFAKKEAEELAKQKTEEAARRAIAEEADRLAKEKAASDEKKREEEAHRASEAALAKQARLTKAKMEKLENARVDAVDTAGWAREVSTGKRPRASLDASERAAKLASSSPATHPQRLFHDPLDNGHRRGESTEDQGGKKRRLNDSSATAVDAFHDPSPRANASEMKADIHALREFLSKKSDEWNIKLARLFRLYYFCNAPNYSESDPTGVQLLKDTVYWYTGRRPADADEREVLWQRIRLNAWTHDEDVQLLSGDETNIAVIEGFKGLAAVKARYKLLKSLNYYKPADLPISWPFKK